MFMIKSKFLTPLLKIKFSKCVVVLYLETKKVKYNIKLLVKGV